MTDNCSMTIEKLKDGHIPFRCGNCRLLAIVKRRACMTCDRTERFIVQETLNSINILLTATGL